ncbi:unnamed protein product [Prunus armeniaca]
MLYIVGLGLADEKDITFRGLEIVKQCEQVFIEAYTYSLLVSLPTAFPRWYGFSSVSLSCSICFQNVRVQFFRRNFNAQENLYGKPVTVTDRKTVEEKADQILTAAAASDVAFLVVGRSFWVCMAFFGIATTHTDLVVQATKFGIDVESETYLLSYAVEGSTYDEDTMCVGCARLGSEDQKIVSSTMKQLQLVDFGAPLHCLVIAGKTHPVEEEMLDCYKINKEDRRRQ